jgi:hypothetical protein
MIIEIEIDDFTTTIRIVRPNEDRVGEAELIDALEVVRSALAMTAAEE